MKKKIIWLAMALLLTGTVAAGGVGLCPLKQGTLSGNVTYLNVTNYYNDFDQNLNTTEAVNFSAVGIDSDRAIVQQVYQSFWPYIYADGLPIANSGLYFNASASNEKATFKVLGFNGLSIVLAGASGSMIFGDPAATAADTVFTFQPIGSVGSYRWERTLDRFRFDDDILMNGTERLIFNDVNTYIYHNLTNLIINDDSVILLNNSVNVNGNLSADNVFIPAYASVTVTASATANALEYNPFNSSNYASFTSNNNIASSEITYYSSSGEFNVTSTGVYEITWNEIINSGGIFTVLMELKVDGVQVWTATPTIHSSVDPVFRGITIIQSLTAGQSITSTIDGSGTIESYPGTTMSIKRIG